MFVHGRRGWLGKRAMVGGRKGGHGRSAGQRKAGATAHLAWAQVAAAPPPPSHLRPCQVPPARYLPSPAWNAAPVTQTQLPRPMPPMPARAVAFPPIWTAGLRPEAGMPACLRLAATHLMWRFMSSSSCLLGPGGEGRGGARGTGQGHAVRGAHTGMRGRGGKAAANSACNRGKALQRLSSATQHGPRLPPAAASSC